MHTFMHVRVDVCVDAYEQVYSTCRVCVRVKVYMDACTTKGRGGGRREG